MQFDVTVVGGSYAGIAAALQIARARRRVAVIDAGVRRNRFADASHGILGQDGRNPAAIVADARAQLTAYPNVTWIDGTARKASESGHGFSVETEDGQNEGRRLVLATGASTNCPTFLA